MFLLLRAIDEVRQAAAGRPHVVGYKLSEGMLLRLFLAYTGKERHWQEMLAAYLRAEEQAPRYVPISLGLADAYLAAGEAATAQETLDALYQEITSPNVFFYSVLLTDVLARDFGRGEKRIEEFLTLSLEHGVGVDKGRAYTDSGTMAQVARRSLPSGPSPELESFLEVALMSMGEENAVREAAFGKEIADTLLVLAGTEALLLKGEEARGHAEHALRLAPERGEEIQGFLGTL